MKNKIFGWFDFGKEKKEDPFFRKDEQGRDLFYPWGYPGEAFYLSKRQKKVFDLCNYTLGAIPVIVLVAIIFLHRKNIINFDAADIVVYGCLLVMPFFYLFQIFLVNRVSQAFIVPSDKRLKKNVFCFWFLFIAPALIFSDFFTKNIDYFDVSSLVMCAAIYTICVFYFTLKIKKTKGYIFNK